MTARKSAAPGRARLEAELRRARNEVVRLARAAAVGELTSAMARELSSPLRAILHDAQAGLQLVAGAPPRLDAAGDALRDIAAQARRASEIVEQIARAVGRGTADRRPLQLEALVGDVVRLLAGEAEAREVSIEVEAAPGLPPVMADVGELRAMVAHAVSRALEAAAVGRRRGEVQVTLRATGDGSVRMAVRDTGPRLGPEALACAFEPLLTVGARGTGAGLALCRAICEAHGGSLALEDDSGRCVLSVMLPGTVRPGSRRGETSP